VDGPRFARTWQREIRRTLITENEQWQLGEFAGSDSGSPVQATMGVETQPVLQPSVRHSACSMAKDDR
jgi:hypothetical protein